MGVVWLQLAGSRDHWDVVPDDAAPLLRELRLLVTHLYGRRAAEEAAFILQAAADAAQRDRAPRAATFTVAHRVPLRVALGALADQRRLTPDLSEFRETLRDG